MMLDEFRAEFERFLTLNPRWRAVAESPCECDRCGRERERARDAWRKWLRRRNDTETN